MRAWASYLRLELALSLSCDLATKTHVSARVLACADIYNSKAISLSIILPSMASAAASVSFLIPPDEGTLPVQPAAAAGERYAYALVLSRPWGKECMGLISPTILVREDCPCTLLMYHGHFTDQAFAYIQKPLGTASPCVLPGAGRHCYAWSGYTSELMVLPWGRFLGAGFACFHCKDHKGGFIRSALDWNLS